MKWSLANKILNVDGVDYTLKDDLAKKDIVIAINTRGAIELDDGRFIFF